MNTRDLIELCHLDALGLLDEQEREEFDGAFASASPALQAQIRAEQARLVKTDWIACEAEPPAGLREAVLDEMSVAMRVADLRPRVLGAVHEEIARRALTRGAVAHGAGRGLPHVYPVRRVSRLWRAAALGFASAAVAFAGTTLYLKGQFDQLASRGQQVVSFGGLGGGLAIPDVHFGRDLKHVYFSPTAAAAGLKATATLYFKPDGEARLVVWRLPNTKNRDYRVVALDDEGAISEELSRFTSDGEMSGFELSINPAKHLRIAIVDAGLGQNAEEGSMLLVSDRLV